MGKKLTSSFRRMWLGVLITWLLQFALWILLTAKFEWPELIAGAIAATLGTTGAILLNAAEPVQFRPCCARYYLPGGCQHLHKIHRSPSRWPPAAPPL